MLKSAFKFGLNPETFPTLSLPVVSTWQHPHREKHSDNRPHSCKITATALKCPYEHSYTDCGSKNLFGANCLIHFNKTMKRCFQDEFGAGGGGEGGCKKRKNWSRSDWMGKFSAKNLHPPPCCTLLQQLRSNSLLSGESAGEDRDHRGLSSTYNKKKLSPAVKSISLHPSLLDYQCELLFLLNITTSIISIFIIIIITLQSSVSSLSEKQFCLRWPRWVWHVSSVPTKIKALT